MTKSKIFIFIGGGIAILIIVLILLVTLLSGGNEPITPPQDITVKFWGIFDDSDVYAPIIDAYQEEHPNVTIEYRKFLWDDYEASLVNAIASQRGPDIFMVHNSWMPKHKDKLVSAPETFREPYRKEFVRRTQNDFWIENSVYAFPLFIDNLALFYNRDLFAAEGITNPPLTWDQFNDYVEALTRFSPDGTLTRSGAAMGASSSSINRATDILLALFLQGRTEPLIGEENEVLWEADEEALERAKDALGFYTDFANPSKELYTWNSRQFYSIDAFFTGKVAMMFNYAYNIPELKEKNATLNFGVATIPGATSGGRSPTVANYWGLAVSEQSAYQSVAWDFISFLTSGEQYPGYINATGRISARSDMLESQRQNPLFRPFIDQAPYMTTPYQPDERKMQDILDEMISSVNMGNATLDQALQKAQDRLKLLIQ